MERDFVRVENLGGACVVFCGHMRNGAPDEIALDLRAQLEQFLNLFERQRRDDRAAMRIERHQPFGLELT